MKQWMKLLLVALAVFAVSELFGQGCAQCKHETAQSIDSDSIGKQENHEAFRNMILFYVGIPAAVICTTLIIVFRKRIGAGMARLFGK